MFSFLLFIMENLLLLLFNIILIIAYIIDRILQLIEYKPKEQNLYQKYGFDEKYKSPEMDKFLESYKPLTEKFKNEPNID